MKTVRFECEICLARDPERIVTDILDVSLWSGFRGYGPLPGVRSAEYEKKCPGVVGSVIRVVNTDGSQHSEEIIEYAPGCRLRIRMGGFTKPLGRLATHFDETWEFETAGKVTRIRRKFELHPRSTLARIPLMGIARLLRLAVERHLQSIADEA